MPQSWVWVGTHDPSSLGKPAYLRNMMTKGNTRHLRSGQWFPGNRADTVLDVQTETPLERTTADLGGTMVEIGVRSGAAWKVRMLSVCRSENARDMTSLVTMDNKEPRLDTDLVAPNANGADREWPSGSGARVHEETDSETTLNLEHDIRELKYYSDDGAESELGEPGGCSRSRPDAASRSESRQIQAM